MDDDNTTNEIDQAILHALLKGKTLPIYMIVIVKHM